MLGQTFFGKFKKKQPKIFSDSKVENAMSQSNFFQADYARILRQRFHVSKANSINYKCFFDNFPEITMFLYSNGTILDTNKQFKKRYDVGINFFNDFFIGNNFEILGRFLTTLPSGFLITFTLPMSTHANQKEYCKLN